MSQFREAAALQIALALVRNQRDEYAANPVMAKSQWDYIAEDAVALADALIVRLKGTPIANSANVQTSPNIIPVEFPKA